MSGRRLFRGIFIAIGALLALIAVALVVLVVVVDFDPLIAKYRDRAVASASTAIGRPVRVEEVEPCWWPFGIEARGVSIEGLGRAERLELQVSLWELVKSFGKDIAVDSIVLVHPVVEIIRDEEGRFSFADIQEHLKQRPKVPMNPETVEMLKRARIDRLAIEDGTLSFVDRAAPGGTGLFFVDDADIAVEEVALGAPAKFTAALGVLSQTHNLELSGRTGPLPSEPKLLGLPEILQANLRANGIPLGAMRLWLSKDTEIGVMDSELSADFELAEDGALMAESTITKIVIAGEERNAKLALDGSAGKDALEINRGKLELGEAAVDVHGRIEAKNVALSFDGDPIDLARLHLTKKPALFEARGRIDGPPTDGRALAVKVEAFRFEATPNVITGSGKIVGWVRPRIEFDARAPHLDVDALREMFADDRKQAGPPKRIEASKRSAQRAKRAKSGARASPERDQWVDGSIAAKVGRVSGIEFRNLDTRVLYQNGELVLSTAGLDTYGGRVIADGTKIELSDGPLGYHLVVRFVAVDATKLFSGASSLGRALDGTLDAKLDLTMRGKTWPDFSSTLNGEIGAHLEDGEFEGVNLIRAVAEPLVAALPFIERAGRIDLPDERATAFRELGATFQVENGLLKLSDPMRVETAAGTIFFTGSIGLDRKLALDGRFELSPDMISELTGGRLRPAGSVPVGVDLGCTLLSPCVRGVDVRHAAKKLVEMEAKKLAPDFRKSLEDQAKKRLKGAIGL